MLGPALLRRSQCSADRLEQLAYGIPLGIVAGSLALLAIASLVGGLSVPLILAVGIGCAAVAVSIWPWRRPERVQDTEPSPALHWGVLLVFGLICLWWAVFWRGALAPAPDGLWAGSVTIWGDWAQHLGDVTTFAYGANFPPTHPRLAGHSFSYHYLSSVTVAAMVQLGLDPIRALPLHSCVLSLLAALGIFAFARRFTGNAGAAALALALFLLGGGLGWWLPLSKAASTDQGWSTLLRDPWDRSAQAAAHLLWPNTFLALLSPQRAVLYGLPLGLLALTLLFTGSRTGRKVDFVVAGLVAGLLPFAHLGTLLAFALVIPFLLLLFPRREWMFFCLASALLAAPQLLLQGTGDTALVRTIRMLSGWIAAPDPWPWFWVKNLGLFLPLAVVALLRPDALATGGRRFLLGFMPVFPIANLVAFQPWPWDNTKVLVYWFLAVCILVAGLLGRMWSTGRTASRVALGVAVLTMILSGVLENLDQLRGNDRHRMLTTEELAVAAWARKTPAKVVFAAGLRHNHPISMLGGRKVVMGFPGWLWSQGLEYRERERDLEAIFALAPEATRLLEKYQVSYLVIGPDEESRFHPSREGFRARYPTVFRTGDYEVFYVGRPAPAPSGLNASSRTRASVPVRAE